MNFRCFSFDAEWFCKICIGFLQSLSKFIIISNSRRCSLILNNFAPIFNDFPQCPLNFIKIDWLSSMFIEFHLLSLIITYYQCSHEIFKQKGELNHITKTIEFWKILFPVCYALPCPTSPTIITFINIFPSILETSEPLSLLGPRRDARSVNNPPAQLVWAVAC